MYDQVINECEKLVDDNIDVDILHRVSKKVDITSYEALMSSTDLVSIKNGETYIIDFVGSNDNIIYAKVRYVIFQNNSIGVIDWIEVHKDIRNNGIGRLLRSKVVSDMRNLDKIYSKIINDKLISVAIDQGFKKIESGDLVGWYIRD